MRVTEGVGFAAVDGHDVVLVPYARDGVRGMFLSAEQDEADSGIAD